MAKASSSKIAHEVSDSESSYSSSSEDVSEDEFGEELTPALDAAILQTLGKIKRREGVYSGENVLQEALKEAEAKAGSMGVKALQRAVAEKPFLLADHHRAALLEQRGQDIDEDEDVDHGLPLTNVQEQRLLREGALNAFKSLAADSDDEDEGDGFLLKARDKQEDDKDKEDEEYRRFLLEVGGGEEEVRKILGMGGQASWSGGDEAEEAVATDDAAQKEKKKKKSKKPKAEQEEAVRERKERKDKNDDDFLMNYILNRGWIDRSEKHVPTYEEVVGPVEKDEEEGDGEASHPWGTLEEEDDFDEKAEEFETAYNFRYEEPGSSSIAAHPRDIPSLVRRADDTRKTKRQARAERKAAEKAAAEEETRRLKGKKRREMEAQIAALKKELGEDLDWTALEKVLDGEWDEAEWERVVGTILSEAAAREDDEKPAWDDMGDADYDDVDGEGYGDYVPGDEGEVEYEDVPFEDDDEDGPINMDADFVDEEEESRKKKSKKDKKDKKSREKPVEVDPSLSVAERAEKVKQTLDEYKALDHEDVIGDIKTRFKYTRSAPVDLGLTPVEILLATDAELNALAGMRHLAPYRRGGFGRAGMGLGKRIRELKSTLRQRRWGEEEGAEASRKDKARVKGSGANADGMGKKRKWGEDAEGGVSGTGESAPQKLNGVGSAGGGAKAGEGPKKRLGKKQRMKAKLAAEAAIEEGGGVVPADVAVVDTVGDRGRAEAAAEEGADAADGGSKKKRKKNKKKSGETA